ncbi:outer membrane beta-barrel family protein [Mucilaginibacter gilvus]|uniref:TonB-dependent receptor n=1 Tax=Mucilaginibacter gilvus TaxID=2305909 RepID=A0A3S3VFY9_9SPHI|nr:outer membrane beta-barrel family protein [Mucilaginibacter gilvus]RWY47463.1 TonB-dependent receptor [Mucilaginibacter gilvus]
MPIYLPGFKHHRFLILKRLLFVLFSLIATATFGQVKYVIKGRVADSLSHKPVSYANVNVKDFVSGKPVAAFLTDSAGKFLWTGSIKQTVSITIVNIGYQTKTITVPADSLKQDTVLEFAPIYLSADERQLKEVVITASKPLIKQEIDRLSYDVQADPDSKTQSVLELIGKVPLLSVDGEENIKLKGSGNFKIFINGRPSSLLARSPKEALKVMPASSVQKIEVITTPPSKYDAEGLAGIINIVLNKRLIDGYNASIGTNYNNTLGIGENASITGKKGKFGITGRAYVYQDFKQTLETENNRTTIKPYASLLSQKGTYSYVGNYHTENVELSYEADTLNLLTASINFFKSNYDDRDNLASALYNGQSQLVQSYNSVNINPQYESGLDLDFNYQLGFKHKKDRLLTFSYQYHNAPNNQSNDILISQQFNYPLNSYRQANENATLEQTFQADYVQPGKTFIVDGGIKAILRRSFSDYTSQALNPLTGQYAPAKDLDNQFDYRQDVYSLYHSWYLKLKPVEIKAGIRLEHTEVNADFVTQESALNTNYTNLIPVVSLQHKFKDATINLGYTQRISRPGILQLNPYIDRSNPLFVNTGNPALKAVLNNNFELAYSTYGKGSYNVTLSYSFSNNNIQQVTTLIDTTSFTTYQNVGQNKTAGLNASISYPITKSFSATLNSELSYLWIRGTYNGNFYANNGMQGFAYATLNYKLSPTWRATASVTVYSANITLQGSTNAYVFNSYRLTKTLLDKKLTITAGISNPYSKFRYTRVQTQTDDFQQTIVSQRLYRTFGLSVSYNFGSLKAELKKNQRSINNDDVTGKNK